ncbi:hypothetical protein NKL07_11315 [Mesorhizobium sp. C280B]|uniref:hypothetical protein n=1 Tax=unclassified Mesorhizobium TaxID=325217 RepID=UPI0003CECE95|nr:hypothetical protein [Mesorhizobium sp. LSJC280B00]ESW87050.1 hypothetical protein X772_12085 [Mesorhizobium sp. LSJC280B00]
MPRGLTRRHFLASSALFTAALVLFPAGAKTDGKGLEVTAQRSGSTSSPMLRR